MFRVFSRGALNHLLERYPNLDEESANRVLTESLLSKDYSDVVPPNTNYFIREYEHTMHIHPRDALNYFFGEENIRLPSDKEGTIYTEIHY